ncbi:MAG: hypothetical protein KF820_05210 [Candidatus Paracaedibacteraceae bacterium]|nr:hypothetical protein [Candidatus Paracaedibacteraceae bacterium]
MLMDIIILANDLQQTVSTYWDKHPIFTGILGVFIAWRVLIALMKAVKQIYSVLTNN